MITNEFMRWAPSNRSESDKKQASEEKLSLLDISARAEKQDFLELMKAAEVPTLSLEKESGLDFAQKKWGERKAFDRKTFNQAEYFGAIRAQIRKLTK